MMRAAIPLILLGLVGCTTDAGSGSSSFEERERAGLARDLSTRVADAAPQSCVPTGAGNRNIRIVDRRTLVYEQGSTIWVNRLPADCPGLRTDSVLIFETYGGQYCRHDRFRAQERGSRIPGPWCPLGEWTAYRRAR